MSLARIIAGILICSVALSAGCVSGLAMGGFGMICAVGFSLGLVGFSALIGMCFAVIMALLWRKAWWAGALAFCVPTLLGAIFAALSGEWQRVVGICICILASFIAAFVTRYPGPKSLRQLEPKIR